MCRPARGDDYVRYSFDHFARTFDKKLETLEYRAPELVAAEVAKAFGEPRAKLDTIDAGCGTGWCGPLLKPYARRLVGVDLSPAMLEKARGRAVYDDLIEAELTAHFEAAAAESCDLIALGRYSCLFRRFAADLRRRRPYSPAGRLFHFHHRKSR